MDTSLPRLAQLEVDLSAAQRSMMGAVPESHSSKPGPEAAGPVEVDDFMVGTPFRPELDDGNRSSWVIFEYFGKAKSSVTALNHARI